MSFSLIILGLISSVLFGGLIVSFFTAKNNSQMIKFSLAFSGGFLLAIIFEHLLPDIYHDGAHDLGLYILFGFLVQLILEYFSGGIEHGHIHVHKGQSLPWALFISL